MEFTYEGVQKWFDGYFEDVGKNQGDLETVPNLKKYFTSDFELTMYTAPSSSRKISMSRDALLISFVHPGLQEDIVPQCTIIDLKQKIVAVQFEIRFSDKVSGGKWDPVQASAHYHLILDENKDMPVIVNTGYSQYRDNFMSWAAEAYVLKSGDLTPLKETISGVLAKRQGTEKGKD